ncbi:MAG: hypothetical protein V4724_03755 [Pseudomonadota bacterium]
MNTVTVPAGSKKPFRLPYWLREFALIRNAVVTFGCTLVIATAAVFASRWHLHDALDRQAAAQLARDTALQRYQLVETEKLEIRSYQPQFAALRDRGLIGEENRLEWVEAIRQIQQQRKLLPISYEIAPQQPVRLEAAIDLGQYQLRGSRMNLHMDLLHEGDLFSFFGDLKERSFYTVQDCKIKRAASGVTAPLAPTLTADCTLNWLTLALAAKPQSTTPRSAQP